MIELENVSFEYDGNDMGKLQDINLKIADGECVLLCGKSGCGKTTILRLINGLIPDYFGGNIAGKITLNGESIPDMEMYERSKYIGSVFQNPRTQFFNVDTDSEIAFGMENLGVDKETMSNQMSRTINNLRLQALTGRSIFELSGGEKQRIAFASVYAMNPSVFLLDEPSSNLDAESIEELRKNIMTIKAQGKTILIAEHRIYYLMDLVDRILYLDEGHIVGQYSKEDLHRIPCIIRQEMGLRSLIREPIKIDVAIGRNGVEKNTLEVKNVSIFRGKRLIQSNLNFLVQTGDIVGIVGENGAGKSTLLRTLCGLHKQYDGDILYNGKKCTSKDLIKQSYMVMQDVNYELFADSVFNECKLGIKQADDYAIETTLKQLDLIGEKDRHPNTLSGGQKQRLAVAVSRICNKKILVFDEPTSGLDYERMSQVAGLLEELSKKSIIFVVTHDIEFVNLVCNKVFELKKGSSCGKFQKNEEKPYDAITSVG